MVHPKKLSLAERQIPSDSSQPSKGVSMTSDIIYLLKSIPHNMFNLDRYIKFISSCAKTENIDLEYTELHHILPKSLFPEFADLNVNKWNSIRLTYSQHFVAHRILWKVYGGPMAMAFGVFRNRKATEKYTKRIITAKIYSDLRKDVSDENKTRKWWNDGINEYWLSLTAVKYDGLKLGRLGGTSTVSEDNILAFLQYHGFKTEFDFIEVLTIDVLENKLSKTQIQEKWKTKNIRAIQPIFFLKKYELFDKLTIGKKTGRTAGFTKYSDADYSRAAKIFFGFDLLDDFKNKLTNQVKNGFSKSELDKIYTKKKAVGRLPTFDSFLIKWNLNPIKRKTITKRTYFCTPWYCYLGLTEIDKHSIISLCNTPNSIITNKRILTNDLLKNNYDSSIIGKTPRELGFFKMIS